MRRQQIIDAVKARFALISTANGYQTECGMRLTEWHPGPKDASADADQLPGLDLRDAVEKAVVGDRVNRNSGLVERRLRLAVIAELREADATAAEARKAQADVERAIGVDQTWGGLAKYSVPVEADIVVDEKGQRVSGARVIFDVVYFRAPWGA